MVQLLSKIELIRWVLVALLEIYKKIKESKNETPTSQQK